MKNLIWLISFIYCSYSFGQNNELLPTLLSLETTFEFQTDTLAGTCFVIEFKNEYLLVTAKHLFKRNVKSGDSTNIQLLMEKVYSLKSKVYFHEKKLVDIAILRLQINKSAKHLDILPKPNHITPLGRECYFLGYPLNRLGTLYKGRTFPFVKRGIVSAWQKEGDIEYLLLDAHNNPGFSGGPIITFDNQSDKINSQYLLGVISGYRIQNNPHIFNNTSLLTMSFKGNIQENSGILVAMPSNYVLDILGKMDLSR